MCVGRGRASLAVCRNATVQLLAKSQTVIADLFVQLHQLLPCGIQRKIVIVQVNGLADQNVGTLAEAVVAVQHDRKQRNSRAQSDQQIAGLELLHLARPRYVRFGKDLHKPALLQDLNAAVYKAKPLNVTVGTDATVNVGGPIEKFALAEHLLGQNHP